MFNNESISGWNYEFESLSLWQEMKIRLKVLYYTWLLVTNCTKAEKIELLGGRALKMDCRTCCKYLNIFK